MSFITKTQFRTGGKSEGERHFRVVKLENKTVSFGGVSISNVASPSDAARKLLKSIAHEKGLEKMKKLNMGKVRFCIQEYTQGSKKKVYGPYVGHYRKYTAEEMKKAKTAKGKVKFTMKPVVKLNKNSKPMTKKVNNNTNNTNNKSNNKSNNKLKKVKKVINKNNKNNNNNNKNKNNNLNNTLKKLKNKK